MAKRIRPKAPGSLHMNNAGGPLCRVGARWPEWQPRLTDDRSLVDCGRCHISLNATGVPKSWDGFWARVALAGPDECWEWQGRRDEWGYGHAKSRLTGRTQGAHRVAYEGAHGLIPDGLIIRHSCDNAPCVNPAHLLTGTPLDNSRDMVERNRYARLTGEANPAAKLTRAQAEAIRADPRSQRATGRAYGISKSMVANIRRGKCWK